jgi:alkylation response protein AidB-like acyl-CoA dehydrogenase
MTLGKELYQHGTTTTEIVYSQIELDGIWLLVHLASHQIDLVTEKRGMWSIRTAQNAVPKIVGAFINQAAEVHGGKGISQDL